MQNKFRNEHTVILGSEKIPVLLRATFENIANTEQKFGGIAYLTWKFSRGIRVADGKVDTASLVSEQAIKSMPTLTECAEIIYLNQANTKENNASQKQYSLEDIWTLVSQTGPRVCHEVIAYLGIVTAGDKYAKAVKPEDTDGTVEKKD